MKIKAHGFVVLTLCLAGCATALNPTPKAYDGLDTTFVGWVRFSGQEFQLNADQDQVLQPLGRPCVSGALPRDLRRQAQLDLDNTKVRITGRTQVWADDLPGDRIDHRGSNIRNECGARFVILGESMVPVP